MKYIKTFEAFLYEKDAIDATEDQIQKAMKRVQKYTSKAAAAKYDIKFKQDKLEYERKKDAFQDDIKGAQDGVQRETEKSALRGLKSEWQNTKQKYKDRLKNMR
jgi:hypothetical protein